MQIYIASQDKDGGIMRCQLRPNGCLVLQDKYPLDRPAYLCVEGKKLYALLREPFIMQSGIAVFDILPDGALRKSSDTIPTHGAVGAYIISWQGHLYCANYLSGTTILMPDRILAHTGSGPDRERQTCSHPHCITPSPDGKFVCITDLGSDRIYLCSPELEPISEVVMPSGSGPRHLLFSRDGARAYCSLELSSEVAVLSYTGSGLKYLSKTPTIPAEHKTANTASAIRLSDDGEALYVSNRGHGSVAVFRFRDESLEPRGWFTVPGASIRDFCLAGDWLLSADEAGGRIYVFSLKSNFGSRPVSELAIVRPWCVIPAAST